MRKLLILPFLLLLNACSVTIDHYKDTSPSFQLEKFFNGELTAHGMIQGPRGEVTRRFSVAMKAYWEGNKGTLEEDFVYDDGEQQRRVWHLTKQNNHTYIGQADDVIGEAIGTVEGFALNWHYTLKVPIDGEIWQFQLNDWMYLLDEDRLLNRATMKKLGIPVAEITLWIEKKH
jgi:hypothetical protein